jgi:UDP-3-O-[3-hydroxymyristoyl] glucosamine N-acyltransferase
VNNTLSVAQGTTVSGTLNVAQGTTLGNTLSVAGNTTLGNTLSVAGATTVSGGLSATGNSSVTGSLNVTGGVTAATVNAGAVSLADVQNQITQLATFSNGQVTLKAVDATNAKVAGQALGDVKATVDGLSNQYSAANAFLDFFKRLFGSPQ